MHLDILGVITESDGDIHTQNLNARAKVSMKANRYTHNGIEFIKFEPMVIKIERGDFSVLKISNLFGGDKIIGELPIISTNLIAL